MYCCSCSDTGLKLSKKAEKRFVWSIDAVSIGVVLIVAVLLTMENKFDFGEWTRGLPHVIGSVNSLTCVVLAAGLFFVKTGRIELHRYAMSTAVALGVLFLVSYVTYHMSNPSNKFAGEGVVKGLYLFILLSHILLSLIVLPLVLRAFYFAVTGQFIRHKKIARFAYPVWLYVAVSGVTVYLMNYQLYPAN